MRNIDFEGLDLSKGKDSEESFRYQRLVSCYSKQLRTGIPNGSIQCGSHLQSWLRMIPSRYAFAMSLGMSETMFRTDRRLRASLFPHLWLGMADWYNQRRGHAKLLQITDARCNEDHFSYGHRRLKLRPAWAPPCISGIESIITQPMLIGERGIRGDLFVAKISDVQNRSTRFKQMALTFTIAEGQVQCAIAPSESEHTVKNLDDAIHQGWAFMISHQSSESYEAAEFTGPVLLVEKADVVEHDGSKQSFTAAPFSSCRPTFQISKSLCYCVTQVRWMVI